MKLRLLLASLLSVAVLLGVLALPGTANQASANPKLLISIPYGDCYGHVTVHIDNPGDWPNVPISVDVQFADNTFFSEDVFNVDANIQNYHRILAVPNDGRAFRYAVVGTGDTIWTDLSCGYDVQPTDTPYVPPDTPTPTCTPVPVYPTDTPYVPENTPTNTATVPPGETPPPPATNTPVPPPSNVTPTPGKSTYVLPNTGVGPSGGGGSGPWPFIGFLLGVSAFAGYLVRRYMRRPREIHTS